MYVHKCMRILTHFPPLYSAHILLLNIDTAYIYVAVHMHVYFSTHTHIDTDMHTHIKSHKLIHAMQKCTITTTHVYDHYRRKLQSVRE